MPDHNVPAVPDIAIYDLDETLTQRATFTPFLIHAAWKLAPWRLPLLPLWVLAMIGHKAGLYDRTPLKTFGMRLMVGHHGEEEWARVADSFAARCRFLPGAERSVADDLAGGVRVIVATAAFAFYARPIAARLGIPEVVGSEWDGWRMPLGNCYGAEKLRRVREYLGERQVVRAASDSRADAPLLDWADEAWFVTRKPALAEQARARGWSVKDFSR